MHDLKLQIFIHRLVLAVGEEEHFVEMMAYIWTKFGNVIQEKYLHSHIVVQISGGGGNHYTMRSDVSDRKYVGVQNTRSTLIT